MTIRVLSIALFCYCLMGCKDSNVAPGNTVPADTSLAIKAFPRIPGKGNAREVSGVDIDSFFNRKAGLYKEIVTYTESLPDKVIVATSITPDDYDCHSCVPLIKCYEWRRDSSDVGLEKEYYLGMYGSFGKPAFVHIVSIGKKEFAYLIESGFSNMGITAVNTLLVKEVNGKPVPLLYLEESDRSNSGDCNDKDNPCYSYESKLGFETDSTNAYYDIFVRKKGTIVTQDKQLQKIDSLTRYSFKRDKYEAISTQ
jgi:hypothetical protein